MTNTKKNDSDSRCCVETTDTGRKTLIYMLCGDCDKIDEMLIVDDSQESNEAQAVIERCSSSMERHSEETKHPIQMGVTEGYEIDLVHIARALTS